MVEAYSHDPSEYNYFLPKISYTLKKEIKYFS